MNILKHVSKLSSLIKLRPIEINGYGFSGIFVHYLTFKGILNGTGITHKAYNGFVFKKIDQLMSDCPFIVKRVFNSEEVKVFTTENSVITFDNYYITSGLDDNTDGKDVSVNINVYSIQESEVNEFDLFITKYVSKTKENTVYALTVDSGAVNLTPIGNVKCPFVPDNYEKNVVDDYNYIVKSFNSKDPYGRLVIINGVPGTGKTYLVKGLVGDLNNCSMVILPSNIVSELSGPSLISSFVRYKNNGNKPIVLIIEDADSCLVPRGSDNISSISSLLNNTDGILGDILDLRIIATTNQKQLEFDSALVRPGRLCKNINIDQLCVDTANKIYNRIKGTDELRYNKPITLAEIYADVYGVKSPDEIINNNKLGF